MLSWHSFSSPSDANKGLTNMAKLFFSYSHKDEDLRNELETHLALLKRQGILSSWHDRRITAGKDVHGSISSELQSSQIILLLVSANFLASDYCYEKEMEYALEKHGDGNAIVIPVILHPCDWHSAPFGQLRATPTDGKPVSMFANQHEAFSIIARDVREAAKTLHVPEGEEERGLNKAIDVPKPQTRSSNLRIKRTFDDHERDQFLDDSYEYIARYFDGSLQELSARNSDIKTRFKRLGATSFSASIYSAGNRIAECAVWYEARQYGSPMIAYSNSSSTPGTSYNEALHVHDDGYTLQLQPLGMQTWTQPDGALSQEGSAEYYWSIFIRPLQE